MDIPEVLKNTPHPVEKEVHILLADIRGFTAISEAFPGMLVAELLNVYFSNMIPVITRHGGTVDKLMGDSILAVFDAGDDPVKSALSTITAATEMQIAMDKVNAYAATLGMEMLYMGIGISTGTVISIVLGTVDYREFTVIGDDVNLASRIEAYTLRGQVLLSEKTHALVKDKATIGSVNRVRVKGKYRELVFFELLSVLEPERLSLPEREDRKSPRVEVSLPVNFQVIKNKIVLDYVHVAVMTDAGYGGFKLHTPHKLETYVDIRLSVQFPLLNPAVHQIYAKVLHIEDLEQGYANGVEITSIGNEANTQLKLFVDINV